MLMVLELSRSTLSNPHACMKGEINGSLITPHQNRKTDCGGGRKDDLRGNFNDPSKASWIPVKALPRLWSAGSHSDLVRDGELSIPMGASFEVRLVLRDPLFLGPHMPCIRIKG